MQPLNYPVTKENQKETECRAGLYRPGIFGYMETILQQTKPIYELPGEGFAAPATKGRRRQTIYGEPLV